MHTNTKNQYKAKGDNLFSVKSFGNFKKKFVYLRSGAPKTPDLTSLLMSMFS